MAARDIPADLSYTREHEWVRIDGSVATVGITAHAASALGDVVYVQLPELGREVAVGDVAGEVESHKSVSEIFAPLEGEVVAVNVELEGAPSRRARIPTARAGCSVSRSRRVPTTCSARRSTRSFSASLDA